jgi:hypothetical protein
VQRYSGGTIEQNYLSSCNDCPVGISDRSADAASSGLAERSNSDEDDKKTDKVRRDSANDKENP